MNQITGIKGKIIKFSIPENHVQTDNFTFTSQLVSILGNMATLTNPIVLAIVLTSHIENHLRSFYSENANVYVAQYSNKISHRVRYYICEIENIRNY